MAWQTIEHAQGPDGTEFVLYRFDDQYMIRAGGYELMSTRAHGSEEALARLACEALSGVTAPRVAIGGLGLGYTLKAALRLLPPGAEVIVAELVPAIVRWNRQETGICTGWPLEDSRVTVWEGDVGALLAARGGGFHAVILDVDNGPEALSWTHNAKLYGDTGIASIRSALAPGGVLAVWAAEIDEPYEGRLEDQGFRVRRLRVPARGHSDGVRHVIYLAQSSKEEEIG